MSQALIRKCVLGMPKLRFKPAYNPYTEPSMEIFAYHEGGLYRILHNYDPHVDDTRTIVELM